MALFTTANLQQLADDVTIRNILERRKVLNHIAQSVATDPLVLNEIKAKYDNIRTNADLRTVFNDLIAQDDDEIKRRVREVIPPVA